MQRAAKLTLKFATEKKRREIAALLEAYRAAVNYFIASLWTEGGRLDKATLARLKNSRLSERYKSQALKQALEIVTATRKSAKALGVSATCPIFAGAAVLDAKFVRLEDGQGSFDFLLRLSVLHNKKRIVKLSGERVYGKDGKLPFGFFPFVLLFPSIPYSLFPLFSSSIHQSNPKVRGCA